MTFRFQSYRCYSAHGLCFLKQSYLFFWYTNIFSLHFVILSVTKSTSQQELLRILYLMPLDLIIMLKKEWVLISQISTYRLSLDTSWEVGQLSQFVQDWGVSRNVRLTVLESEKFHTNWDSCSTSLSVGTHGFYVLLYQLIARWS